MGSVLGAEALPKGVAGMALLRSLWIVETFTELMGTALSATIAKGCELYPLLWVP